MTDDQRTEALKEMVDALKEMIEASMEVMEAHGARVDALEEAFTEFISSSAEEDFMEERQRWIDTCRERAAERRRTS